MILSLRMDAGAPKIRIALKRMWFTPVFAVVLAQRRDAAILLGVGALHMGLNLLGLPGWQCPIKATLGFPCPGCGLTLALIALLRGQWRVALATHAFAPVFLIAILVMIGMSLLPEVQRQRALSWLSGIEQRTGITAWILVSLLVYWGLRLFGPS